MFGSFSKVARNDWWRKAARLNLTVGKAVDVVSQEHDGQCKTLNERHAYAGCLILDSARNELCMVRGYEIIAKKLSKIWNSKVDSARFGCVVLISFVLIKTAIALSSKYCRIITTRRA